METCLGFWWGVCGCQFAFWKHHCPMSAQGHARSVWRASPKDKASGNLLVRALAVERQIGRLRQYETPLQAVFCEGDSLGDDGPSRRPRQLVVGLALRVVPSSCNDGCQRASFELLVKTATSHLLALRVTLRHRLHSTSFVLASCMAASATSLLGWLRKSETSTANMATPMFSGMTRRRSSMYNRKRSGDKTDP